MSGGELFQRVADADCLTEKEASFYMYQLLQGLQYMHMKNIVHLDLKVTKTLHTADHIGRQRVVSVPGSQSGGPGPVRVPLGSPEFKSSATFVTSQQVCLRPVGILINVMFSLDYLFKLFARRY